MAFERACIFDMDGTIVDNMSYHSKAWAAFFRQRGTIIDEDEFFLRTAGRQGHEIMREYLRADLLDAEIDLLNAEKEALYRELYAPHRNVAAGFDLLIEDAKRAGVALAVATAAPLQNIAFTLDEL